MDIQKVASTGTAVAVLGTGAFVGGNHQIDKMQGGPQRREDAKIEAIMPSYEIGDSWENPHHNNWVKAGGWKK